MSRSLAVLCCLSPGVWMSSTVACSAEDSDAGAGGGGTAGQDSGQDASGGSAGGGGADAAGDAPSCPAKAQSCPSGCEAILGERAEPAGKCWIASAPIGCWPGAQQIEGLTGCVKDPASGSVYRLASTTYQAHLVSTGEWTACASADWSDIHVNCP